MEDKIKLIVNGKDVGHLIPNRYFPLPYNTVILLTFKDAYKGGSIDETNNSYSVSYHNARVHRSPVYKSANINGSGIMIPGDVVFIKDGTVFNVVETNNA